MTGSTCTTRGVRIAVEPHYLAAHSDPARHHWMHAYTVTITNEGASPVRLVSRHWIITNAHGTEEHVRGAGVVGEQPLLRPGQSFRYTSGCPMDTPVGTMHGSYQMVGEDGQAFDAEVAPFTLSEPFAVN